MFGKWTVRNKAEAALEDLDRSIYTQRLLLLDAQAHLAWLESKRKLLLQILDEQPTEGPKASPPPATTAPHHNPWLKGQTPPKT